MRTPTIFESTAVLALGMGLLAITLLSLTELNVSFARTSWTALLAMILAAPVLVSYARFPGPHRGWRRVFWSVALTAYLIHFYWAVFRTFGGNFSAISDRQGFVAYNNYAVTIIWTLDVSLCWFQGLFLLHWTRLLRNFTQIIVGISFVAATAIFRTGFSQIVGISLMLTIAVAFLIRCMSHQPPGTTAQ